MVGCRRDEVGDPWRRLRRDAERVAVLWLWVAWGDCDQESFGGACYMVMLLLLQR